LRTGVPILTGASELASVTATAFVPGHSTTPDHTRLITLAYATGEEACKLAHSPVRLLSSIQESAWGTDSPRVDLPPVTFAYGDATLNLMTPQIVHGTPWGMGEREHAL
jgi:hypothetical protein